MNTIKENTFAAACYEQNSIAELQHALARTHADKTDCQNWSITDQEWREQIKLALDAKIADRRESQQ